MVKVDFCCNPHPIGIAADFFKAVRFGSSCKDDNTLPARRLHEKRFVVFVLAPVTASAEDPLQAEAVADADVKLCVRNCGSGRQVDTIRGAIQLIRKGKSVVNRLARADRPLCNVYRTITAAPHVVDVFL